MINPKLQYCTGCGMTWEPKWYHKLVMLLWGSYSRTCPRCGTVMNFRLVHHVVKVGTETIKNRDRVWKNG